MPTGKEPAPTAFSRAVAAVLLDALTQSGLSIRALARIENAQSLNYYAVRFRNESSFTTTDIEFIAKAANIDPFEVGRMAAESSRVGGGVEANGASVTQLSSKQRKAAAMTPEELEQIEKQAATRDPELDADEPPQGR